MRPKKIKVNEAAEEINLILFLKKNSFGDLSENKSCRSSHTFLDLKPNMQSFRGAFEITGNFRNGG